MTSPLELNFAQLCRRHEAILLDAFGVLVDASGALPGAGDAVRSLRSEGRPFLVVTNDASRSPERAAARLNRLGIPVDAVHIMSSGMMIGPSLLAHNLGASRVVVLGTEDSARYASDVGAQVVKPSPSDPADAVVIADEGSDSLLDTMDDLLSMLVEAHHQGRSTRLLLANPDLVYPTGSRRFGFTAGSFALMIEHALRTLIGDSAPRFEVLGKPATLHFNAALERVGTRDAVMLGDTLHTDVAGANQIGIKSAIVLTGVTTREAAISSIEHSPTYLLADLL